MGAKGKTRGLVAAALLAVIAVVVVVAWFGDERVAPVVDVVDAPGRSEGPSIGDVARPGGGAEATAVELPDVSAPLGDVDVTVRTVTAEDGAPVEGVDVVVATPEGFDVVGRTDEAGEAVVTLETGTEAKLLARSEAWRSDVVTWGGEREVILTLTDGGVIRGFVRQDADPAAECDVIAVAADTWVDEFGDADLFAYAHRGVKTTTDADGRFALEGLELGTRYRLTAAGPGVYITNGSDVMRVEPPEDDVVIHVGRVHGLRLRYLDENGEVPDVGSTFVSQRVNWPMNAARPVALGRPWFHRVGLVDVGVEEPFTHELLAVALYGAERIEFIQFRASVVGYTPAAVPVVVPPITPGEPLAEQVVTLQREHDGTAMLTLEVVGGVSTPRTEPTDVFNTPAFLRLRDLDAPKGRRASWYVPYDTWPRNGDVLEAGPLPLGTYAVSVHPGTGAGSIPDDETAAAAAIVLDQDRRKTLHLPDLASVRVDVTAEGAPYDGYLTVELRPDDGSDRAQVTFRSGPYVVDGVRPGPTRVVAWTERYRWTANPGVTVDLVPGAVNVVAIDLRP